MLDALRRRRYSARAAQYLRDEEVEDSGYYDDGFTINEMNDEVVSEKDDIIDLLDEMGRE